MHDVARSHFVESPESTTSVISFALRQALRSPGTVLDNLPIGVYTCDRDGILVEFNRKAAELWGRSPRPGDTEQRFCGAHKLFHLDGRPLPHAATPMADVLRTGQPARDQEVIIERLDGTRVTALVNIDPLHDQDGELLGAINCFQDISELKRAEAALAERERWYRELLEALPAAIYTTDPLGRITFYNQAAVDLSGRRPQLGTDHWCVTWKLRHTDGTPMSHDQCPMAVALQENRSVRGAEAIAERPDGTLVPFIPYPTPLRDDAGTLVGAVNMLVDITERKQAETHQRMLLDELNHRVKNTLSTVQSLASHTMRGSDVPKSVREAFEARLFALSTTHNQLMREQWEAADLKLMFADILAPHHRDGDRRVRLDGASVRLKPQAALTLSMVLHELATNAAKYGALSSRDGRLAVTWDRIEAEAGPRLRIDWQESGGPPVGEPEHRGFGSRLLERGIAGELGGNVDIRFDPAGLQCRMDIPLT